MSSAKVAKVRQLISKTSQNMTQTEVNANNNELRVFLLNYSGVILTFDKQISSVRASDILNKIHEGLSHQNIDNNKPLIFDSKYKDMFAIWVTSMYLELQLQPLHKPFNILANWDSLLIKYGPIELMSNPQLIEKDEPTLSFQRNVFSDKQKETAIELADIGTLRLLYLEAKLNVLDGRYPSGNYEELAAIQAAIDLGPFDKSKHTTEYFRNRLNEYIPCNYINSDTNKINELIRTLSRSSHSNRCSQLIVSEFEKISKNEPTEYKLMRKYMEICWSIPCYGSAYFSAQIERPAKSGLASLMNHFDLKVWVALNREGIHIISKESPEILLSIGYNNLYWAIGCPKDSKNPDCIPCLFIQIPDNSNNNILQIFSRQIKLIEALINSFLEEVTKDEDILNQNTGISIDCTDGPLTSGTTSSSVTTSGFSFRESNGSTTPYNSKKLSFATFDNSGHCINKSGSWVRKK